MEDNNKYISMIVFLRKFISIFFSLFFNIYILKIVNNDLNFILKYMIYSVIVNFIFEYIILKIINSKNAKLIYRLSFPMLTLCIIILIVFKESIVSYIYLFRTLYSITTICYSAPYELIIIGSNNDKRMSSFLANLNILESITTILTPIFSGFIIEKFSYNMLFLLLIIETIIIICVSFNIKDFTVSDRKMNLKEYLEKIKNQKHIKSIYKCMFYRRISSKGAIVELLPIILFLRLNKEFSFGAYNSIFAIISILSLQILKIINKRNINKNFYVIMSVCIFISSILASFYTSFNVLIIYYILMYSFGIIIESESCSFVYSAIKINNMEKYKKEHILVFNIYMTLGEIISYSVVYLLINYFYNVNIISISVSVLMFFLIISCIYLTKTYNYMKNYKENV